MHHPEAVWSSGLEFGGHRPHIDFHPTQQYYVDVVDWIPSYELRDTELLIEDPVWGKEVIGRQKGDDLLIQLACQPVFRRLQAIEQLTLPRNYTTIPNTSLFSRWEHVWGSVVLVRRLARQHDIGPAESLRLQLRTLLSDAAHTTGSHLGDWLFQGVGGSENQHDEELMHYLEITGVNKLLQQHGISPEEVALPEIEDWVECPAPALCVDRLDYALREIRRWVPAPLELRYLYASPDEEDLVIEDGQLVMTKPQQARLLADAFIELGREHWYDPVHRMQLALYMERAKRVIADEHGQYEWLGYHPRDIMYCSDPEYLLAMQEHDTYGHALDTIMSDIARYERTIGWQRRRMRTECRLRFEDGDIEAYEGIYRDYLPHHPIVRLEANAAESPSEASPGLDFPLSSLKPRHLDPAVLIRGELKPLSQHLPSFEEKLARYKGEICVPYLAHIAIADKKLASQVVEQFKETNALWQETMSRPHMDPQSFRQHVGEAALWGGAHAFVEFRAT